MKRQEKDEMSKLDMRLDVWAEVLAQARPRDYGNITLEERLKARAILTAAINELRMIKVGPIYLGDKGVLRYDFISPLTQYWRHMQHGDWIRACEGLEDLVKYRSVARVAIRDQIITVYEEVLKRERDTATAAGISCLAGDTEGK